MRIVWTDQIADILYFNDKKSLTISEALQTLLKNMIAPRFRKKGLDLAISAESAKGDYPIIKYILTFGNGRISYFSYLNIPFYR